MNGNPNLCRYSVAISTAWARSFSPCPSGVLSAVRGPANAGSPIRTPRPTSTGRSRCAQIAGQEVADPAGQRVRGQGLQGKGRRLIGSIGGTAAPWGGVVKFIDSIGRHLVESRVPEPQLRVSGFADLEQAKSFL